MTTTHLIRKLVLALGLAAVAGPAAAEAHVWIQMNLPVALPPLVVVQPGVQVVQDYDEEIFFSGGFYWVQRDGYWYRARDPRARWYYVRPAYVPVAIARMPPGQYRHWHGHGWKGEGEGHGRGHHGGHRD